MNKKRIDQLVQIKNGERPSVLLVGNGINLSFSNAVNTESIIREEWKKHYDSELGNGDTDPFWKLPFTSQVVVSTRDHVQSCMSGLADVFKNQRVDDSQKSFLKEVVDCGFDVILSTNYSLEFEKAFFDKYTPNKVYRNYKKTRKQTSQQEQFGIYQCTVLPCGNLPTLWHIHGTALRKKSLIMGQLYYGKLMQEVIEQAHSVSNKFRNQPIDVYRPLSWIDYFLLGDLYIFGFAMDYSETDIWWLISYKKSCFPESSVYYYGCIDEDKKLLFDCYEVNTPNVDYSLEADSDYLEYYRHVLKNIDRIMKSTRKEKIRENKGLCLY